MADNLTVRSPGAGSAAQTDAPEGKSADKAKEELTRLKDLAKARTGKRVSDKALEIIVQRRKAKIAHQAKVAQSKESFESSQSKEKVEAGAKEKLDQKSRTTGAQQARSVKDGLTPEQRESIRSDPKAGPTLPPTDAEATTPEEAKQVLGKIFKYIEVDGESVDLKQYAQTLAKQPPTEPKQQKEGAPQPGQRKGAERAPEGQQPRAQQQPGQQPRAQQQPGQQPRAQQQPGQQPRAQQQPGQQPRTPLMPPAAQKLQQGAAAKLTSSSSAMTDGAQKGDAPPQPRAQHRGQAQTPAQRAPQPQGRVPLGTPGGKGPAPRPMSMQGSRSGSLPRGPGLDGPSVSLSMKTGASRAPMRRSSSALTNSGGALTSSTSFDGMHFNWDAFFAKFLIRSQKDMHLWRKMMKELRRLEGQFAMAAIETRIAMTEMNHQFERLEAFSKAASEAEKAKLEFKRGQAAHVSGGDHRQSERDIRRMSDFVQKNRDQLAQNGVHLPPGSVGLTEKDLEKLPPELREAYHDQLVELREDGGVSGELGLYMRQKHVNAERIRALEGQETRSAEEEAELGALREQQTNLDSEIDRLKIKLRSEAHDSAFDPYKRNLMLSYRGNYLNAASRHMNNANYLNALPLNTEGPVTKSDADTPNADQLRAILEEPFLGLSESERESLTELRSQMRHGPLTGEHLEQWQQLRTSLLGKDKASHRIDVMMSHEGGMSLGQEDIETLEGLRDRFAQLEANPDPAAREQLVQEWNGVRGGMAQREQAIGETFLFQANAFDEALPGYKPSEDAQEQMQEVLEDRLDTIESEANPDRVMRLFRENDALLEHMSDEARDLYAVATGQGTSNPELQNVTPQQAQQRFVAEVANVDPDDLQSWTSKIPGIGKWFADDEAGQVVQAARRYTSYQLNKAPHVQRIQSIIGTDSVWTDLPDGNLKTLREAAKSSRQPTDGQPPPDAEFTPEEQAFVDAFATADLSAVPEEGTSTESADGKSYPRRELLARQQDVRQVQQHLNDPLAAQLPHLIRDMDQKTVNDIADAIEKREPDSSLPPAEQERQRTQNKQRAQMLRDYNTHEARQTPPLDYGSPNMIQDLQTRTGGSSTFHSDMNEDFDSTFLGTAADFMNRYIGGFMEMIDLSHIADKAIQGAIGTAKQSRQEIDSEMRNRVSRAQGMINQLIELMGMSRQF